jgi:hypothetical protein
MNYRIVAIRISKIKILMKIVLLFVQAAKGCRKAAP